jgi:hypothetical protein
LGATAERIAKDRSSFGPLLETFVFSEVLKQASWFGESCALYHYRDKDQDEVDLVIETGSRALVGIEVKSSATVNAGDFRGLRKLAEACDDNFKLGVVLYDGGKPVPFGDRLVAEIVIFKKLYSQSSVTFRTWVPSAGYISLENLNRRHFLVGNGVLQHVHPPAENACSQWHEVGVILDHMNRMRTGFPFKVSSA